MKFIPSSVSRQMAKAVFQTKQNSPKILFAAGVVGMGATVVTACKATLRVEEVLTKADENRAKIDLNLQHNEDYSEDDAKHDTWVVRKDLVVDFAKIYALPTGLGAVTLLCFTQAHRIQTKRIAGLSAALALTAETFEKYRERVREELGDEKDREFYYGVTEETIQTPTENGMKKQKVKRESEPSGYARWFDKHNPNFNEHTPSLNEHFLSSHQIYANRRLQAKGYLLLNDVYEALGYEPTEAGCVVGWVYGHRKAKLEDEGRYPDGYIDFGFGDWPSAEDFARGTEDKVLLEFNVDGEIARLIGSRV